ncbi:MAG: PAS domain S-box protein [Vicinamibacterales bacterium]
MLGFFARLLDASGFVPRRLCGEWTLGLVLLHNVSDLLIWLAYLAIPVVLLVIARRRKDVVFRRVFFLFLAFIVSCGFTHALDVVMFYDPLYRLLGLAKALTAAASWATVVALVPIVPKVLAMRRPDELEAEIVERRRVEGELRALHAHLEERVAQRTAELEDALAALRLENDERARAERQLRASREQLRAVTDNAPVWLLECDPEQRCTFVNRPYADSLGLTPQQMVGKRLPDVLSDRSYARIRVHLEQALSGTRVDREIEEPTGTPDARWMHLTCLPSYSDAGAVTGAIAMLVDVTDRRTAENLLRTIADTIPAHVAYVDRDCRYQLNNLTYERWFDRPRSEITGRHMRELLPEATWDATRPRIEAALAGATVRFEVEAANARGERRWFDVTYTPDVGATGAVAGVVVMGTDITDEKIADLALRASEARFRHLADAMPQIVWTAGSDGTLDYYNDRWYAYTGMPRGQVGHDSWTAVLHPDDLAKCLRTWHGAVQSGEPYHIEYRFRNAATGEYRWHLGRALPVRDEGGRIVQWLGTCTDIDDQKRAETSLLELNDTLERQVVERTQAAESERRWLDAVLEALPVAVIIGEPGGRLTRMNRACEQVWGLAPLSSGIDEYVEWVGYWPATGARIQPEEWALSRALLKGESCPGELVEFIRFGDGSRRTILNSGAPVWGPDGNLLGAVVASMDMTGRTADQAALRESEERFRGAFDAAPIGMALVAPDGRWLQVNRSLCEMVGYTEQELLATDFQTITHAEDLDTDLNYVRQVLEGAISNYQMEKRYIHKQRHIVNILLSVSLVRDVQGRPTNFVAQIKNITQQKSAEKALAAQDALLRQFIRHSPAAIAMFDAEMRYLQMSDRWLIDYHLSAQDVTGLSHYEVFPEIPEAWKAIHRRVLAGAVEKCDEDAFMRADGSTEWLQWECRPWLDASGGIGGLIMFTQVITRRKLVEEKVKASLREKEVLLKEIHHRVKNNLQIVSTLLNLQSGYTRDPATLAMFQESRGRVRSMALIHERLYRSDDLSRVDFAGYTRQLVDDLYRAYNLSDENVRLELDVDVPELGIDVAVPCGLLLNELITNCLKYAFVDAAAGRLRVGLHRTGGVNVLTVSDDGVGFPATIDFRNTASFGLQLVNTLVDQLDGEITMAGGPGTTFTVRFPTSAPQRGGLRP